MKKKNVVFEYYNSKGWKTGPKSNITLDEEINANNNLSCKLYNTATRQRVLKLLDQLVGKKEKLLDVASGPLHLKEFLEYSKSFNERHCVDFSSIALEKAKLNLVKSGQKKSFFYNIDFLYSDFESNLFDAAISLHTLYHVEINKQKDFVEKLIKYVRPGGIIIIVYSNPFSLQSILTTPIYLWQRFKSLVRSILINLSLYKDKKNDLYFKRNSIFWWNDFAKYGDLKIIAERTFNAKFEKKIIPDNNFGEKIYKILYSLENFSFWKYFSSYHIVIIKKKI